MSKGLLMGDEKTELVKRYCNNAGTSPVHDLIDLTEKATILRVVEEARVKAKGHEDKVPMVCLTEQHQHTKDVQEAMADALTEMADELEARVT